MPGIAQLIRIGPVSGGLERSTLVVGPLRVALGGEPRDVIAPKRRRVPSAMDNAADLTFSHDFSTQAGSISIEGNVSKAENFLKVAAALWQPVNHGWELTGQAAAATQWNWKKPFTGQWNGRIAFSKAILTVAGLNQPLRISEGALDWVNGLRTARDMRVDGFGATWSGFIEEKPTTSADDSAKWDFHLSADHLDAAELDRWVGPRARPGWLQRLMSSLLGESSRATPASELVRRVNAEGELDVQELIIEKLKLERVRAKGSLRDLKLRVADAEAEWAGGTVHAKLDASFLPRPAYNIAADLDHVNLAQLPGAEEYSQHLSGFASGTLHLRTEGVGRDELLAKLAGQGDLRLNKVEFRGWDVNASVADGSPHAGTSRWPLGDVSFRLQDRSVSFDELRLDGGKELTLVNGTISFAREADLSIETATARSSKNRRIAVSGSGHVLKISGSLDGPRVSLEKVGARQPAD